MSSTINQSELDARRYANRIRDAYTLTEAEGILIKLIEAEKQSLLDELETVVTHEYTGGTALEPVEYLTIPKQFIRERINSKKKGN